MGSLAVTSGGSEGGGAGVTTCWYVGSGVVVVALSLHAFARPFCKLFIALPCQCDLSVEVGQFLSLNIVADDELADVCEFLSLISMLLLFQSGIVFKMVSELMLFPVDTPIKTVYLPLSYSSNPEANVESLTGVQTGNACTNS